MGTELGEAKSLKSFSYEVHDSVTPSPIPENSFSNTYPSSSRKPHRTLTDILCCSRRRHQVHPTNTSRRTSPPPPSSNYSDHNNKSSSWVLDPQGKFLQQWNKIFLISCLVTAAIDPLFFYIPYRDDQQNCLALNDHIKIAACILRTLTDLFYLIHIILQFQTGFISPHSRVFGRGELVKDSGAIARRYLSSYFWVDVLAVAPLPQVAILFIIPNMKATVPDATMTMRRTFFLWQLVPRLIRITPIYKEVTRTSGIITQTAWAGAAFNLFIYVIASHMVGALWYCFALSREEECRRHSCKKHGCDLTSLYCVDHTSRSNLNNIFLRKECLIDPEQISGTFNSSAFNYGMYQEAVSNIAQSTNLLDKLCYCFWWGLRNLSSLGQNLHPSTYFIESLFSVIICILGLVLFALLIGNMQKYLQSTTARVEEMRVRRQDAEQWMSHRLLSHDLRKNIRRYEEYKWQVTKGVDEENLMHSLPRDLRRDIKRHVCLPVLNGVAMLRKMDEQLKDAMCCLLKPVLYIKGRLVFKEGDPVSEMVFIMRGRLMTTTTNGGQTGFFNLEYLKQGDFCGEELLTWALNPHSSHLPASTRTVSSLTDIEAFSISPDDIKFIAAQYRRRLNSKQLRRTFRSQSQQWRTWAACFIQAAWHQFTKKKLEKALKEEEDVEHKEALAKEKGSSPTSLMAGFYSSRFAANDLRSLTVRECLNRSATAPKTLLFLLRLQKPAEPDFSSDDE